MHIIVKFFPIPAGEKMTRIKEHTIVRAVDSILINAEMKILAVAKEKFACCPEVAEKLENDAIKYWALKERLKSKKRTYSLSEIREALPDNSFLSFLRDLAGNIGSGRMTNRDKREFAEICRQMEQGKDIN